MVRDVAQKQLLTTGKRGQLTQRAATPLLAYAALEGGGRSKGAHPIAVNSRCTGSFSASTAALAPRSRASHASARPSQRRRRSPADAAVAADALSAAAACNGDGRRGVGARAASSYAATLS
jgi:hypothetical protein